MCLDRSNFASLHKIGNSRGSCEPASREVMCISGMLMVEVSLCNMGQISYQHLEGPKAKYSFVKNYTFSTLIGPTGLCKW